MVQGDKYSVAFTIKKADGTAITSSNCDGVRIQIGNVLKSTDDGTVTYNAQSGVWLYPITQAESLALPTNAVAQVQIKIGSGIYGSQSMSVKVKENIIKEAWANGN